MKFWNQLAGFSLAIVVVIGAAGFASAQDQTTGVVRISDLPDVGQQMKQQAYKVVEATSGESCQTGTGECQTSTCDAAEACESHEVCIHRYTLRNIYYKLKYSCPWCCFGHGHCDDDCDGDWDDHCRKCPPDKCPYCKNGHCPYHKGHGGHGYKARRGVAPFGCYTIAYPVNPEYCDGRDGRLYAAQGYGINVSVPLAPNVGAAYNYGWGIPSSRLTNISNTLPVPPMPPMQGVAPIVIRNR